MSILRFRAGPSGVAIGVPSSLAVPSLASLSFSASGAVADTLFLNSFRKPLLTTDTYQVLCTLVGQDTTSDGWSCSPSSPSSGNLVLSGSQNIINVTISNANWPSNFGRAAFVAVWIKINSGDFQLAECAPIDTINDMVVTIKAKPMPQYTQIPLASMIATAVSTTYPELGDRAPKGFTFSTLSPTTGNIDIIQKPAGTVTFTPNTAADFTITSSRSAEVRFSTEANDVNTFVQASFGDYAQTTVSSHIYQSSDTAINTAQIIVQGNRPFIATPPPDPATGISEQVLFTSLLLKNQDEITQSWSKKQETPTPFHFITAPVDFLFNNAPTVFTYSRN